MSLQKQSLSSLTMFLKPNRCCKPINFLVFVFQINKNIINYLTWRTKVQVCSFPTIPSQPSSPKTPLTKLYLFPTISEQLKYQTNCYSLENAIPNLNTNLETFPQIFHLSILSPKIQQETAIKLNKLVNPAQANQTNTKALFQSNKIEAIPSSSTAKTSRQSSTWDP